MDEWAEFWTSGQNLDEWAGIYTCAIDGRDIDNVMYEIRYEKQLNYS